MKTSFKELLSIKEKKKKKQISQVNEFSTFLCIRPREGTGNCSSILAWEIPWAKESARL